MRQYKISPRFDSSKLRNPSFDDYVDVYEDRVRGWLIDCGNLLNQHEHAGFGALQIALAYFEGCAVFLTGQNSDGHSYKFFKKGFLDVFPSLSDVDSHVADEIINIMYKDGRCGLFHIGMARKRISLSDGTPVFRVRVDESNQVQEILIDRQGIIQSIEDHLSNYISRLRNPNEGELRTNFTNAWRLVHQ